MKAEITESGPPTAEMRDHTHVTGRARVPNVLRVRTVDWPEREAFVAHLDRLKKARNIRYDAALAEMAEFHPSVISNWRSGKQRPSLSSIVQLAEALSVDKHDLAARAGVAEGFAQASVPTQLPAELELLLDQWQTADPNRRAELLTRVQFVTEWFEATTPRPADERQRRAG